MQARLCSLGRPVHRCLLATAPATRPRARSRFCCKARAVAQPREVCPVNMVSSTIQPHRDVAEILLTPEALALRVAEVGRQIAEDYADKQPLVIGTLKGAIIFLADLVRDIHPVPDGMQLDFLRASSYGSGTASSGKVAISDVGGSQGVAGRHVLLVEDIVDSGRTAARLMEHFRSAGAASVKLVSLLSKPARREVEIEPDYCCFEVEDKFVVGYGLDFDQMYRTLPYVGVLRPECYGGH